MDARAEVRWFAYLNTALMCAVLVLVVAALIGVYRPGRRADGLPAGMSAGLPAGLSAELSAELVPSPANSLANGRTVVIPMGFYYGTFVMHCWLRSYSRPFRMRVDTGSSVVLFGDLPGCIDGGQTVCKTEQDVPVITDTVQFGENQAVGVRTTELLSHTVTFGFIQGVPRIEPKPIRVRVADNSRSFVMPLGFAGGKDGLMNQLTIRRLEIWLVQETWSIRMPCQVILSPAASPDPNLVILHAPLVPADRLVAALNSGDGTPLSQNEVPTYVFEVIPQGSQLVTSLQFAIVDIGSTLSYVPIASGDKITEDVVLGVVGTGRSLTLSKEETIPLTHTVALNRNLNNKVAVIGNRALNHLVIHIDLDDGPTGTIRLMRPS
jgi:hypothetical protein